MRKPTAEYDHGVEGSSGHKVGLRVRLAEHRDEETCIKHKSVQAR